MNHRLRIGERGQPDPAGGHPLHPGVAGAAARRGARLRRRRCARPPPTASATCSQATSGHARGLSARFGSSRPAAGLRPARGTPARQPPVADRPADRAGRSASRWSSPSSAGARSVSPRSDDDEVAFTEADLEAMRLTQRTARPRHDQAGRRGRADPHARPQLRPSRRVADDLLGRAVDPTELGADDLAAVIDRDHPGHRGGAELHLAPARPERRLAVAARSALDDEEGTISAGIGFADIVGYTRQTRSLNQEELARLVDVLRGTRTGDHHGARRPDHQDDRRRDPVRRRPCRATPLAIALELVEEHLEDEDFPQLRVGVAWGPVLAPPRRRLRSDGQPRLAAHLDRPARPRRWSTRRWPRPSRTTTGSQLRRMRRTSVKGYRRLEPWALRRPDDDHGDA